MLPITDMTKNIIKVQGDITKKYLEKALFVAPFWNDYGLACDIKETVESSTPINVAKIIGVRLAKQSILLKLFFRAMCNVARWSSRLGFD